MNVRGLVPSLGAGGSLIAAAVCALAVFGGVLAFRGPNAGTAEAGAQDLTMPTGAVLARRAATKTAPVAVPASAPSRTTTTARQRTAAPPPRATASLPKPKPTAPRAEAGPTSPAPAGTAPRPATWPPAAEDTTPIPLPAIATPTPGTVTRAVQQTRAAAKPVVDAAPQPVEAPVNAVGDTAEQVAGTVDQTVDALLP